MEMNILNCVFVQRLVQDLGRDREAPLSLRRLPANTLVLLSTVVEFLTMHRF